MTSTEPDERTALENEIFEIIREHYDCDGGPEVAHIIADLMQERIQTARAQGHWFAKSEQVDARPTFRYSCACGYASPDKKVIDGHVAWKLAQLKAGEE